MIPSNDIDKHPQNPNQLFDFEISKISRTKVKSIKISRLGVCKISSKYSSKSTGRKVVDLLKQSAKEPFGHINLPPFYLLPWTPSSTTIRPGAILVRHHSKVHLIWDKKMQKGWICKMKYPIYLEHFFLKECHVVFCCFFLYVFHPLDWLFIW